VLRGVGAARCAGEACPRDCTWAWRLTLDVKLQDDAKPMQMLHKIPVLLRN